MTAHRPDLAILVHDLSSSGVVRNAIRIAGAAAATGMKTELWVLHNRGAFASSLPEGVAVHILRGGRFPSLRRLETLLAIRPVAAAIAERSPRILLSAGNHFHLSAGLAYRLARRPAETRFMGRASNSTPLLRLPGLSAIANAFDAFKYREMRPVIAVSQELADDLNLRLGIPRSRIAVIINGVDLKTLSQQAESPLDDPWYADGAPPVVVSAGRMSRQKNHELLIEAFGLLRQQRQARLLILGEGSNGRRRKLLRLIQKLGLGGDVRLHGFEANPMRYFARSALFVLSSRWEGASNALLEAMACGCPIVATDCPTGIREQLDHGRIGPVVPVNDAKALADAMLMRMSAPRGSEQLRQQAARFDHARMLDGYMALFSKAAMQSPP